MSSTITMLLEVTAPRLIKVFAQILFLNISNFISFLLLITILFVFPIVAQPSGGPYGPVQQTYDLPQVSGKIYFVAPNGKSEQTGETVSNPTTIEVAMEKVKTGDAIVMRGGTYRTGNLVFNQGITIQPYKDEIPILKGTFVAKDWKNLGNGLWITHWTHLFPSKPDSWWQRLREGKKTPLHKFNNDMVFVDGKFLQSTGWEGDVDENTFYIDYETGTVYIGIDPKDKLVEITAFDVALLRTVKDAHAKTSDHKGYTIKGVTLTQYAYRAIEIEGKDPEGLDNEANHGKDVVGSIFENCTITYCSRVAGYFRGDNLTIRSCKISDTSTEGVYVIGSSDILLEKNIFTRNNIERITGYYPAAVKIFNQCYRATCKDNLIIDLPYSNGIWYDVGNVDGRFINNWVQDVGNNTTDLNIAQPWPSDNGFFFEISKGVICAGNIFINCDHGLWILNSSNAQIYQNTFINSTACIARNARSAVSDHFGWHPSTGPDVDARIGHIYINNLMIGDENFNRPLLYVWQPDTLCGMVSTPQLNQIDYNIYVRQAEPGINPLILWSLAKRDNCKMLLLQSPEELQKLHPEFSNHSKYFVDYHGPLFKGQDVGNYQLLQSFPGSKLAYPLPSEIKKMIGQSKNFIGAYPSLE
jgi:parallel beta-helix repeat protein